MVLFKNYLKWRAIQLASLSTVDPLNYLVQLQICGKLRASSIRQTPDIMNRIFQNGISKYLYMCEQCTFSQIRSHIAILNFIVFKVVRIRLLHYKNDWTSCNQYDFLVFTCFYLLLLLIISFKDMICSFSKYSHI